MGNQKNKNMQSSCGRRNGLVRAVAFATSISLTVSSVFAYSTVKSYAAEDQTSLEGSFEASAEESSAAASSEEDSSAANEASSEGSFDEAGAGAGNSSEDASSDASSEADSEEETDEDEGKENDEEADAADSASSEASEDTLEEKKKSSVSLLRATSAPASIEQGEDGYENFTEDTVVADFLFGTENGIPSENVYSEHKGYGFSDVDFDTDPVGWSGNIYFWRRKFPLRL